MWSTCPKQKAIRVFDRRSTVGLMAFQRILLEDILDFALHIATSFKIVRSEAQLSVLNAAVYMRKKKKCS